MKNILRVAQFYMWAFNVGMAVVSFGKGHNWFCIAVIVIGTLLVAMDIIYRVNEINYNENKNN